MASVTIHSDFRAQEEEICHCFHLFPFYLPWSDGTGCHDLSFFEHWILSCLFHSPLSPSLNKLFSSSLLSAIKVVASAYLRLLIFLPAILILVCASSSLAFHMMCSAYKLNEQDENIQPSCTPFWILNQSVVPYKVLTLASWPAYIQVSQETGKLVWYAHHFKSFPQLVMTHTVKGFSIVNEAELDFFFVCLFVCFYNSLVFSMIQQMLAIWSLFLCLF